MSNNLDLNTATEQQIASIQGMNKDYARKIVDFRNQNGKFDRWDDLENIPGLQANTLETLKHQGCTISGMAA